ncbi:MAG: amidohydrolase, partial [Microscillaceae bacterium]|nr:amidohydrolase [Microscillaceae bacterium]MDW8460139.1 amidohydrolase [Cytophagales bacterium]
MKKNTLLFAFIFVNFYTYLQAQTTFPTNGVQDERQRHYAFINATIFTDYQTKIENGTLIIKNGTVQAVGKNLPLPKEATVIDLKGKFIYPSLIDLYSTYGMPPVKRPTNLSGAEPTENANRTATAWNQALKAENVAEQIFVPDNTQAEILRKLGFGTVLTHNPDGILRGTGAVVSLAEGKAQEVVLKGKATTHFSFNKGSSPQDYPSSLMGAIALIRQTYYDADWYAKAKDKKEFNTGL